MLVLENISVTFNQGTELERSVLKNVCLEMNNGEFIVIIGGNGAGKTTLLEVISGTLSPDEGKVWIAGQQFKTHSCVQRSQKIAHVLQDPRKGTIEQMTIFENLAFAEKRGQFRGGRFFETRCKRKRFQEKLSSLGVGLENRLDHMVGSLSGGQRQALSLIMAIMAPCALLLLDEITAALDPKQAEIVVNMANQIVAEEGKTCIMVTHNMAHALKYGHRTLILDQGKFVQTLTQAEKLNLNSTELAAYFTDR